MYYLRMISLYMFVIHSKYLFYAGIISLFAMGCIRLPR